MEDKQFQILVEGINKIYEKLTNLDNDVKEIKVEQQQIKQAIKESNEFIEDKLDSQQISINTLSNRSLIQEVELNKVKKDKNAIRDLQISDLDTRMEVVELQLEKLTRQ